MSQSLIDRLNKLESEIQPTLEEVVYVAPTDAEFEAYATGARELPEGVLKWNMRYVSVSKLRELLDNSY